MARFYAFFAVLFLFVPLAGAFPACTFANENTCLENGDDPKAYPNPFKSKITINHGSCDKIEICNLLGEIIKTVYISPNEKSTSLDLSELRKGVYFYVIKENNSVLETRRIIKSE